MNVREAIFFYCLPLVTISCLKLMTLPIATAKMFKSSKLRQLCKHK